jgi:hypothetical protein
MATFLIATRTGHVDHGGTDFDVHARVKYSNGSFSEWKNLDNRGDDREQGDLDIYSVSLPSGSIDKLQLRVKHERGNVLRDPKWDDWYLTWLAVAEINLLRLKDGLYYHPNQYFSVPKGDLGWHILDLGAPTKIPLEVASTLLPFIPIT